MENITATILNDCGAGASRSRVRGARNSAASGWPTPSSTRGWRPGLSPLGAGADPAPLLHSQVCLKSIPRYLTTVWDSCFCTYLSIHLQPLPCIKIYNISYFINYKKRFIACIKNLSGTWIKRKSIKINLFSYWSYPGTSWYVGIKFLGLRFFLIFSIAVFQCKFVLVSSAFPESYPPINQNKRCHVSDTAPTLKINQPSSCGCNLIVKLVRLEKLDLT